MNFIILFRIKTINTCTSKEFVYVLVYLCFAEVYNIVLMYEYKCKKYKCKNMALYSAAHLARTKYPRFKYGNDTIHTFRGSATEYNGGQLYYGQNRGGGASA